MMKVEWRSLLLRVDLGLLKKVWTERISECAGHTRDFTKKRV